MFFIHIAISLFLQMGRRDAAFFRSLFREQFVGEVAVRVAYNKMQIHVDARRSNRNQENQFAIFFLVSSTINPNHNYKSVRGNQFTTRLI